MKVKQICKYCGQPTSEVELKPGDIIKCHDGSGMNEALHRVTFLGNDKGFKPLRILKIVGDMAAVVPLHWDDTDVRFREKWDKENPAYLGYQWIWGEKNPGKYTYECLSKEGFWIDLRVSSPELL